MCVCAHRERERKKCSEREEKERRRNINIITMLRDRIKKTDVEKEKYRMCVKKREIKRSV